MPRVTSKVIDCVEVTLSWEDVRELLICKARKEVKQPLADHEGALVSIKPDQYRGYVVTLQKKET